MKIALSILALISLCILASAQSKGQDKTDACDKGLTFCWYGPYSDGSDEVEAWGNHWVPQDASEKPLEVNTEVRCVKRLRICIKAGSQTLFGRTVTRVDILPITHWGLQQIAADGEGADIEPCERDTFVINRIDRTVLMLSSPGPNANSQGCMGVLGKPKTIVYKLAQ